jgi:hypothetical protein
MVHPGFGPIWGTPEDSCPRDPEKSGWMIPLEQHVLECGAMVLLGAWAMRHSSAKYLAQLRGMKMVVPASHRSWTQRLIDILLCFCLIASLALIVYHKYQGHKMAFLLQPCHVLHAFLIVIFFLPRGSGNGALCFSLYLHLLWAPLCGLIAADLTCYKQWMELQNWAAQHLMLLCIPLFFIASGRFPLYSGRNFFMLGFSMILIFHFGVLAPVSLITACNLNYMTCP